MVLCTYIPMMGTIPTKRTHTHSTLYMHRHTKYNHNNHTIKLVVVVVVGTVTGIPNPKTPASILKMRDAFRIKMLS